LPTLVRLYVRELVHAQAKVLTSVPHLLQVIVADMFERAPRICEVIFEPLLQIGIVADINDAHAQRGIKSVETLASGNILREFVYITYGMNQMPLRCRVIDKRLQGR
jgi:hypothetical protein